MRDTSGVATSANRRELLAVGASPIMPISDARRGLRDLDTSSVCKIGPVGVRCSTGIVGFGASAMDRKIHTLRQLSHSLHSTGHRTRNGRGGKHWCRRWRSRRLRSGGRVGAHVSEDRWHGSRHRGLAWRRHWLLGLRRRARPRTCSARVNKQQQKYGRNNRR